MDEGGESLGGRPPVESVADLGCRDVHPRSFGDEGVETIVEDLFDLETEGIRR